MDRLAFLRIKIKSQIRDKDYVLDSNSIHSFDYSQIKYIFRNGAIEATALNPLRHLPSEFCRIVIRRILRERLI